MVLWGVCFGNVGDRCLVVVVVWKGVELVI